MTLRTRCPILPTALLGLAPLAGGCANTGAPTDTYTPAETRTDQPVKGRPELGTPSVIPGHPVCIVPLRLESTKGPFQDQDPYTRGGAYSVRPYNPQNNAPASLPVGGWIRWHNALFRDLHSNEEWLLLETRGVVSAWHPLGEWDDRGRLKSASAHVFIVTRRDTNADGVLNDLDERVALVTRGDGRDPREATPAGAQVWGVAYDPGLETIFFQVVADTNGDGRIDHADEPVPHALGPEDAIAGPVVGSGLIQRATALLR